MGKFDPCRQSSWNTDVQTSESTEPSSCVQAEEILLSQGIILTFLVMTTFGHLEKEMATHSSILALRIPWTEELGGLHFVGSLRVRHT